MIARSEAQRRTAENLELRAVNSEPPNHRCPARLPTHCAVTHRLIPSAFRTFVANSAAIASAGQKWTVGRRLWAVARSAACSCHSRLPGRQPGCRRWAPGCEFRCAMRSLQFYLPVRCPLSAVRCPLSAVRCPQLASNSPTEVIPTQVGTQSENSGHRPAPV
jgi:hypothetical protein